YLETRAFEIECFITLLHHESPPGPGTIPPFFNMARDILGPCLTVNHCALLHQEPNLRKRQNNKPATRIWIGCQDIILRGEHHCSEDWRKENKYMRYMVLMFLEKLPKDMSMWDRPAIIQEGERMCAEELRKFQAPTTPKGKETDSWTLEWERYGQDASAPMNLQAQPEMQLDGPNMLADGGSLKAQTLQAYPGTQPFDSGMFGNGVMAQAANFQAHPGIQSPDYNMLDNGWSTPASYSQAHQAAQHTTLENGEGPHTQNEQYHLGAQQSDYDMLANGFNAPAPNPQAHPEAQYTMLDN
ncbi:MAG: hypothetical protein Q9228_007992, partial [Teloschistes exilis]